MLGCVCAMRTLLAAFLVAAAVRSASAVPPEKLASCCKRVSDEPITEPITGYIPQQPRGFCVTAVIFQTADGLFCRKHNAPWVIRKVREISRAKAQANRAAMRPRSADASHLSIITTSSSSVPPSSSTSRPSTSSTPSSASSSFTILSSSSSSPPPTSFQSDVEQ